MSPELSHDVLKGKERTVREHFPEVVRLRVHRSISWIGRAETFREDADTCFILLWIAFNAAYAGDAEPGEIALGERASFEEYFRKIVRLDNEKRVYNAIWKSFSGPIHTLINNKYVFGPFWRHYNGVDGYEDWEQRFATARRRFEQNLRLHDTPRMLSAVFDRLYVLRNQLMHGGSTWNSSVNRRQIQDGADILSFLLPAFVDIMMDHPNENWGKPFYPVVRN